MEECIGKVIIEIAEYRELIEKKAVAETLYKEADSKRWEAVARASRAEEARDKLQKELVRFIGFIDSDEVICRAYGRYCEELEAKEVQE